MDTKKTTPRTLDQPDRLWSLAMVRMTHDENLSLAKALELAAREMLALDPIEWDGELLTPEELRAEQLREYGTWTRRARIDPKTLIVTVKAVPKV